MKTGRQGVTAADLGALAVFFVAFVCFPLRAQDGDGERGDLIFLPVRWCALEGTLAVTNPGQFGEATTDAVLSRRHGRAADWIFLPGARLALRSAMTAAVGSEAHFPVIPDPHPPDDGGPGARGAVLDALIDDTEIREAHASCLAAWDELETALGTNLEGPVAINVLSWVDREGNFSSNNLLGIAYHGLVYPSGRSRSDACADPRGNIVANDGDVAFAGVVQLPSAGIDPHDRLLAHEMGHILFLGHGNGLDDDSDGIFDSFCDVKENLQMPPNLMSLQVRSGESITALQKDMLRAVATATPGSAYGPAAAFPDADVLRDSRVDAIRDAGSVSVDILTAAVAVNEPSGMTSLSHTLFGRIPAEANVRFVLIVDLDGDPSTGGEPSTIGFPTGFRGAELVTEVTVRAEEAGEVPFREARPVVWKALPPAFGFVEVVDDRISAELIPAVEGETAVESFHRVSLQMPTSLHDPQAQTVFFQAIAQELLPDGALDRLPQDADDGAPLFLARPSYPEASIVPAEVEPGDVVVIEGSDLTPGATAAVLLGDTPVVEGPVGPDGRVRFQWIVPDDVRPGIRLVTVEVAGTALAAVTALTIERRGGTQLPGDCNQDGRLDLSDAVCLFGVLFLGEPPVFPCGNGSSRDAPNVRLLDWQPDGRADLSDGVGLLNALFLGGPPHFLGTDCVPVVGCPERSCR